MKRQATLLDISRGVAAYDRLRRVSERELALMRRIDEMHLEHAFAGSQLPCGLLRQEGHPVGRLPVV